jgi:hypothetical protein
MTTGLRHQQKNLEWLEQNAIEFITGLSHSNFSTYPQDDATHYKLYTTLLEFLNIFWTCSEC